MQNNTLNKTIEESFRRHEKIVEESLAQLLSEIQKTAEVLIGAASSGHKILTCGNGGSAADAQHLAAEWVCRYKNDRRPLAAIALTVDTSALTAISNDYDFENVFSRQVEALGVAEDVLVAFTTSGKSKNILKALQVAKNNGLKTIVLTGEKGGNLKSIADITLVIPSEETARIQEIHELIYHIWCEIIDERLAIIK